MATHGVVTAIATDNIVNTFTPYGDALLIRMANLHANIAQLACDTEMSMVCLSPAHLLSKTNHLQVGNAATIVLLDSTGPNSALCEIARVVADWKNGRKSFDNGHPQLYRPV